MLADSPRLCWHWSSERHVARRAVAVPIAMLVAATMLVAGTGAGCSKGGEKRDIPLRKSESQGPADYFPRVGERIGERISPNGRWMAYAVVSSTGELDLVIQDSKETKYVITDRSARPVAFTPDSRKLLFSGSSDTGYQSLFVVMLPPTGPVRQLTNIGVVAGIPHATTTPSPYNDQVEWLGKENVAKYKNPEEPEITINVDSGEVTSVR